MKVPCSICWSSRHFLHYFEDYGRGRGGIPGSRGPPQPWGGPPPGTAPPESSWGTALAAAPANHASSLPLENAPSTCSLIAAVYYARAINCLRNTRGHALGTVRLKPNCMSTSKAEEHAAPMASRLNESFWCHGQPKSSLLCRWEHHVHLSDRDMQTVKRGRNEKCGCAPVQRQISGRDRLRARLGRSGRHASRRERAGCRSGAPPSASPGSAASVSPVSPPVQSSHSFGLSQKICTVTWTHTK